MSYSRCIAERCWECGKTKRVEERKGRGRRGVIPRVDIEGTRAGKVVADD